MSLTKYDKYKDSGVDWLGIIPEHWDVMRITNFCIQNKNKNSKLVANNLLSLSFGHIVRKDIETSFGLLPATFESYQVVNEGYIILRLTDLQNDKRSLRVGYVKERGIITSAYLGLIFERHINRKYCFYLLHSFDIKKVFYSQGGSMRQSMKFDDFKTIPLLIPSFEEQTTIARYIDNKTQNIDKKIKLLTKKTTHYQQYRKSLINETVCRGLDKNVKLKDSGIEWIGMIPEHWEVKRLKDVCGFINRGSSPNYDETGLYKVVNQATFSKGIWDESSLRFTQSFKIKPRGLLKEDDILIASTGGGVLGKVYFFKIKESDYIADSHITILRDTRKSYFSKYIYYYFSEKFKLINDILAQGSTNQTELQKDWLLAFFICIPPKPLQIAIASYLDQKTQKIDSIVSNIKSQIEILKEFRKTLINDVVTGKIKVTA